jgi:integrase
METFLVSPYPARPKTPWKLTIPEKFFGRRIRKFYRTEAEAWASGPAIVESLRRGGTKALESQSGMSMKSAVREYLATKSNASPNHSSKINRVCAELLRAFPGAVSSITPMDAAKWFASVSGSPTTRAGWHRYASGFFRWCADMEVIPRNPLKSVKAPKAEPKRSLLTPVQLSAILESKMSDPLRAWFLLGAFAGLRSIEVHRMRWEDIDTKTGQIEVRREVSKQSTGLPERIVDFTAPLKKRCNFFKKKSGLIVPQNSLRLYRERERLIDRLNAAESETAEKKIPWSKLPENALRHSFATYHLASGQDAAKTAHQLGHSSTALVLKTYAVPARKADWRAWWRL